MIELSQQLRQTTNQHVIISVHFLVHLYKTYNSCGRRQTFVEIASKSQYSLYILHID